jgi:hypothetical protein
MAVWLKGLTDEDNWPAISKSSAIWFDQSNLYGIITGRQSAVSQFSSSITATTDRNMHTWMLAVNGYGIGKLGDLTCK